MAKKTPVRVVRVPAKKRVRLPSKAQRTTVDIEGLRAAIVGLQASTVGLQAAVTAHEATIHQLLRAVGLEPTPATP